MNAPVTILALLALAAPHASSPAPAPVARAASAEEWVELLDAWELAEEEYEARLLDAEPEARRELRRRHPAQAFWPRFERAAASGEGRALLWLVRHAHKTDRSVREWREEKRARYEELFAGHVGAPWFGEVLGELAGDRRVAGLDRLVPWYELAIAKNASAEVRAQAMYQLGLLLRASDDAEAQAAGEAWLERAMGELAETRFGQRARAELVRPVVGEPAPDFTGETIDGATFRLSDYRGKVVLLDFYGFW